MKTLLILLAMVSVCYGRMGETEEECKKRYGKILQQEKFGEGVVRYTFNVPLKGGEAAYKVEVYTVAGKARELVFRKFKSKPAGSELVSVPISVFEATEIVKKNTKREDLEKTKHEGNTCWEVGDYISMLNGQGSKLRVMDIRHMRKIAEVEAKDRTDGL